MCVCVRVTYVCLCVDRVAARRKDSERKEEICKVLDDILMASPSTAGCDQLKGQDSGYCMTAIKLVCVASIIVSAVNSLWAFLLMACGLVPSLASFWACSNSFPH
ncbi:unnamed protein product [Arctogadus glacialis]